MRLLRAGQRSARPLNCGVRRQVMQTFEAAFPELSAEVERALAALGQPELGRRFASALVREITSSRKAGYIQLAEDAMGPGRTLPLHKTKSSVVLDVGTDGSPIGVEVLAPDASTKAELRRRAV